MLIDAEILQSCLELGVCKACTLQFVDPDLAEALLLSLEAEQDTNARPEIHAAADMGHEQAVEEQLERRVTKLAAQHDLQELASKYLAEVALHAHSRPCCPCCNGYLSSGMISELALSVHQSMLAGGFMGRPVVVNVVVPPSLALLRVVCRTAVHRRSERSRGERAVAPLEDVVQRLLVQVLQRKWDMQASPLVGMCNGGGWERFPC